MPIYSYKCTKEECGNITEDRASMSDFKDHTTGCSVCGSVSTYVWVPSVPQVSFLDGPSGSWPSKGNRFKKYRAQQSANAERRQNERYGPVKEVLPNYNGKETGSWEEAQRLAKADKGNSAAVTYDNFVSSERKSEK